MTDTTSRLALPLIAAGQAQKELFHNEALAALDVLVQPVVETVGDTVPPVAPAVGRSWIVGGAPTGAWAGRAGAIATWTDGGWRFAPAFDGMRAWVRGTDLDARRQGGAWTSGRMTATILAIGGQPVVGPRRAAIAAPAGGATVDGEARAAIVAIIAALAGHGLIST